MYPAGEIRISQNFKVIQDENGVESLTTVLTITAHFSSAWCLIPLAKSRTAKVLFKRYV